MADTSTEVCSMCGDIGFPDKIFLCIRCRSRFQHSYCSNYYKAEEPMETVKVCDWCLSTERSHVGPPKKVDSSPRKRSESYPSSSSNRVKRGGDREDSGSRGKSSSSSKTGGQRYKLLKDVL